VDPRCASTALSPGSTEIQVRVRLALAVVAGAAEVRVGVAVAAGRVGERTTKVEDRRIRARHRVVRAIPKANAVSQ
jgi:hypothetical protein